MWAIFRRTNHDCVSTNKWKSHRYYHQRKWGIPWYHRVSAAPVSIVEEITRMWGNTHTTPSARRCTKTCPPGITLGSVSPFNSFTTHVKSERAPGVKQRLKITCDSGMATSARIDAAAFFCHSSDSNVAMARTRICRRVFVGVSSHAGNARWAASIAARQSSEDADAAMEASTPV